MKRSPGGDGYETVDEEVGDTSGLEEEEDSFVDIDGTLGTRCDREGGIRGTGMVGKRVEVITSSGGQGCSGPVADPWLAWLCSGPVADPGHLRMARATHG